MKPRHGTVVLCATALAACSVGPDYQKPEIHLPANFSEPHPQASAAAQEDLGKWWMAFHDAELNSLVARALAANLDLQSAASRVRQAREQEIIAGAAEWPGLSASGLGLNLHSNSSPLGQLASGAGSGGSGGSGSGSPPSGPTNIRLYSVGLDASWQPDLFGGTRRAMEAAHANTQAALWDLRDGEVTLTAEIAADYLGLRAAQARIAMLDSELKDERVLFGVVRARADAGFVTQLDVNQQRTVLANAQAQIPQLEAEADAREHAIAVLLAQNPETIAGELKTAEPIPEIPPGLPAALPVELLRRRPDIREAERKLAAATANEGVAIADLYPKINLIGAATFAGSSLGSLFSTSSFGTAGIASIMWPIFQGGRIRAGIRASKEVELQAYFAWRKSVLGALRDVEDALVRYADEERHERAILEAERAAASSETIARQQYTAGLVTFVNVLTAETALLSARDQLIQSREALALDLGTIYKALGGGWDETSVHWEKRPGDPENR
ncbi:MAG: efflux transporter outer membrane subunit [Rhizomicrobium sp.]